MKFLTCVLASSIVALLSGCGGGGGSSGSNSRTVSGTDSSGSTSVSATFTVGPNSAASIALAAGDKIDASDDIFYAKRFAATVAGSNGRPVVGARVSLGVTYPGFYKGRFNRSADFKVTSVDQFFCPGEDANNNDTFDPGEDTNGSGGLDPAKALVTATIEGDDATDEKGNVRIVVRWPKAHASWILYRLNTSVTVTGTEGKSSFNFTTSYLVGDDELASTPFVRSPFGVSSDCRSTN